MIFTSIIDFTDDKNFKHCRTQCLIFTPKWFKPKLTSFVIDNCASFTNDPNSLNIHNWLKRIQNIASELNDLRLTRVNFGPSCFFCKMEIFLNFFGLKDRLLEATLIQPFHFFQPMFNQFKFKWK